MDDFQILQQRIERFVGYLTHSPWGWSEPAVMVAKPETTSTETRLTSDINNLITY